MDKKYNKRANLSPAVKRKIRNLRKQVTNWGKNNKREFAWRANYNSYSILIAELFLQRTKAEQAEKQYKIFIRSFPNLKKLKYASATELSRILKPLGLKKRVILLKKLVKVLDIKYNLKIPKKYEDLIKLPGVGDYTANAIIIFAFNKPTGLVDANTIKIFSELFNLRLNREQGKKSKFIRSCAEYYSSLGNPRITNWLLLDYALSNRYNRKSR